MEVTTRQVLAMVTSRLDYCNAAPAGLLQATVAPLQRVENSATRPIFKPSTLETRPPMSALQLHCTGWLKKVSCCTVIDNVLKYNTQLHRYET